MKINEVYGGANEGLRGAIYKATGGAFGGITGEQQAIKSNYITRTINQLKLNSQAAKRAGQPFDMKTFLDRYTSQYGWDLSPQEQASIDKMAEAATMTNNSNQSLTKIANYLYMLASQNQGASGQRSPGGTTVPTKPRQPTKPSNTPASEKITIGGQTLDPNNPADAKIIQQLQKQQTEPTVKQQAGEPISPTAEKIMAAIGSLKGPTTKEDLDTILRDAAYLLSRIDKPRYANTLRELTAGVSGAAAAGTKASMYSDVQSQTQAAPKQYTDVEQAMPGYGKATDDLALKMNPPAPAKSSAERAYRPGSRRPTVTDINPRMKK
jgi:hypothetical protein